MCLIDYVFRNSLSAQFLVIQGRLILARTTRGPRLYRTLFFSYIQGNETQSSNKQQYGSRTLSAETLLQFQWAKQWRDEQQLGSRRLPRERPRNSMLGGLIHHKPGFSDHWYTGIIKRHTSERWKRDTAKKNWKEISLERKSLTHLTSRHKNCVVTKLPSNVTWFDEFFYFLYSYFYIM